MKQRLVFRSFPRRVDRSQFVFEEFSRCFGQSILDIGCHEAPLRSMLKGIRYTGVDLYGNPDIHLNLEETEKLPFADGDFECVLCIETLEHLDNFHKMFDEAIRCTSKYAVISLPNCWRDARVPIERGRGHFAHYGLPPEPPPDRHKWFFNLSQARDFFVEKATVSRLELEEIVIVESPRPMILRMARKMRYWGDSYLNRYAGTIFAVCRKPGV